MQIWKRVLWAALALISLAVSSWFLESPRTFASERDDTRGRETYTILVSGLPELEAQLRSVQSRLDRVLQTRFLLSAEVMRTHLRRAHPGPPEWTKEQVRQFVGAVLRTAADYGENFVSTDTYVSVLAAVGEENADVLVHMLPENKQPPDVFEGWEMAADIYIPEALRRMVTSNSKSLIVDTLREKKRLVRIVVDKGWVEDAREVLLHVAREEKPGLLPHEWVRALAQLKEPETYPVLREYLIYHGPRHSVYGSLVGLPDFDLTEAVMAAWEWAKVDGTEQEFCLIAMSHGSLDALEVAVSGLGEFNHYYYVAHAPEAIRAHTEADGTPAEIRAWFRKNEDRLEFDETQRVWRIQP